MKAWIIPALTLSVLLASPAAIAASSDQNGPAQQHQQLDKPTKAKQAQDKKSNNADTNRSRGNNSAGNNGNSRASYGPGAAALSSDRSRSGNANDRNLGKYNDNRKPDVVVKRRIEVDRNIQVKRRVSISAIRRNFNSPHRYHWNVYNRPRGWYVHRWTYGERLPNAWFVRDYWISDFVMFGLMMPPDGYVWVRVGDDALLVDTDTGEVVRVVYGVFY